MQLTLELPFVDRFAVPPPPTLSAIMSLEPPAGCRKTRLLKSETLAKMLRADNVEKILLIDSRSFMEYNVAHVTHSINVTCSKIVKRRLQQNKLTIKELLASSCKVDADATNEVVVYDQCTSDINGLLADNFLGVLLTKLNEVYKSVSLLSGGFASFQSCFPILCESQNRPHCPARAPLSQPCLPVSKTGPTRVLGFLYLGSQQDVMSEDCLKRNGINYVLNVSKSCPIPEFLPQTHFHRIPVRDNHSEKILPWLDEALEFIDKVRSANGSVIVHCLAGISRSPTVAIAYIMRYLNMNVDDAYKYVKEKRATISPNFNFLGQLLEYEKTLRRRHGLPVLVQPQPAQSPKEDPLWLERKEKRAASTSKSDAAGSSESSSSDAAKTESSSAKDLPSTGVPKCAEPPFVPLRPSARKLSLENLTLPLKCSYMPGKASPRLSRTLPRVSFADTTTTPTSDSKSMKRSMSRDALTDVGTQTLTHEKRSTSHLTLDLKNPPSRTLQRPSGLDVKKVSLLGPVYLDSPGDSKKPRSLCNSPSGLLEQLAWGTSHLSVHSPEVRNHNPFVEACAKFQAQQSGSSANTQKVQPEGCRPDRPKLTLEGLVSNSETVSAEARRDRSIESKTLAASATPVTPSSPSTTSRSQRRSPSQTSVGFQFGRSRINNSESHTSPSSSTSAAPNRDHPKLNLPTKPTFGPQTSPPPCASSSTLSASSNVSNPFFSRQTSGQSITSDLSLSTSASPALDSAASSVLDRRSSVSSGISPDLQISEVSSAGSCGLPKTESRQRSNKGQSDAVETAQVLPSGWNPFSFPQLKNDDSPSSRGENIVWQKRKESGNSEDESGLAQRLYQSPTTAMDRVATYITKCNFGSPEASDSESSESTHAHKKKCNNKKRPKLQPSVRSQSCEEISSCSREAVVSEIVVSTRRDILDYNRSTLDQEEEDFDTRSLSSQRSLSSSCEMIEVS